MAAATLQARRLWRRQVPLAAFALWQADSRRHAPTVPALDLRWLAREELPRSLCPWACDDFLRARACAEEQLTPLSTYYLRRLA